MRCVLAITAMLVAGGCSRDPFPRSSLPRFQLRATVTMPSVVIARVTWDAVPHATAYRLDSFNARSRFRDSVECAPNPKSADDFRAGKAAALNFLKGQVMKLSKGKANPALAGEILERKLKS